MAGGKASCEVDAAAECALSLMLGDGGGCTRTPSKDTAD